MATISIAIQMSGDPQIELDRPEDDLLYCTVAVKLVGAFREEPVLAAY
jgi:hypothetical protein